MAIDGKLLEILRCPETQQTLTAAGDDVIADLNRRISEGQLVNRGGDQVDEPIDGGLVRDDGLYLYPIRDDIPEMLIESGIALG